MRRILTRLMAVVMMLLMTSLAFAEDTEGAPSDKKLCKPCYTYLNHYRQAKKIKPLKRDASLEKIALIRAREMAVHNKFSHTRPNGKSSLSLIKGNRWKGENIARGYKNSAQVSIAWYKSRGHRANMLRKRFTKVGIACFRYRSVTYWVQIFSN